MLPNYPATMLQNGVPRVFNNIEPIFLVSEMDASAATLPPSGTVISHQR